MSKIAHFEQKDAIDQESRQLDLFICETLISRLFHHGDRPDGEPKLFFFKDLL
jgi:hypothetical protein